MVFPSWSRWRRQKGRAAQRPAGRAAFKPGIEALEERWVPSTITKVQDLGTQALALGNASSLTLTVPGTGVAAGHSVIVEVAVDQAAGTAQVSDSAGNTYSQDAEVISPIGRVRTLIFSAHAVHALTAGQAITVSLPPGSLAEAVSAAEFSGIDALTPRDQVSTNANWSFDAAPSSGPTGMTAQANELVVGAIGLVQVTPANAFLPGAGATGLVSVGTSVAHGINVSLAPEYQVVAAKASLQASGSLLSPTLWATAAVTYRADPATHFVVTTAPASTAGAAVTLTVTALDDTGHVATSYTGTVHLSSTDAAAQLPADYAFTVGDAGVHTFTAVLKTAGSRTLTASDPVSAGLTGSAAVLVTPAAATHFSLLSSASATAGAPLSFTLTALDAFNNVATGYTGTIHVASQDGAATLPANFTFGAGDAGVHTFSATLKTAGNQNLVLTDVVNSSLTASAAVVISPAAASHFAVSAPAGTTAGAPLSLKVTALDAFNNVATGYTGTVHLTSTDAAAVLAGDYAFVAGDAGIHTLAATLKTAGNRTLTATDAANGTTTGGNTVLVAAAAVDHLSASAAASTTAGAALALTVTAQDVFNNTVTSYTGSVHLSSTDSAAVLPGDYTYAAADGGVHTFGTTLRTAGPRVLAATDSAKPSLSSTAAVTVTPAAATHFSVSAPGSTTAGAAVSFTLTAQDAFNNTATGYTGTVHFSSSDTAATVPADYTFLGTDAGVHTLSATLKTAGSKTLNASDAAQGSLTGAAALTVAPAAAVRFAASTAASTTAGLPVALTVTAFDGFGNVATGYTGTVHVASTDAAALLPSDYTFLSGDAGIHTFSPLLKTAGNRTLTVTDSGNASISGGATVAVIAAEATHFSMNAPASTTAGVAASFTLTALDTFNNIVAGYTGSAHFTSTDGSASLPSDYSFAAGDGGTHTFSFTLRTAGNRGITATDSANSSVTGGVAVAVMPGAPASFSLAVSGGTTVGAPVSVTVTALDAFRNVATGYTGTVQFTSTDAGALLPANYAFTSADAGIHTFLVTFQTAGSQGVSVGDQVNAGLSGTLGGILLNNPVPTLTTITPTAALEGSGDLTVTVQGGYFVHGSVVNKNGVPLATTFVSTSQLTATLTAADLVADGPLSITVFNPGPGGGVSSAQSIAVVEATITGSGVALSGFEFTPLTNVAVTRFTHGSNTELGSAFSAVINWGDGTSSAGTVALSGGTYTVLGSHTYTDEGTFAVSVMVTHESVMTTIGTTAAMQEELLPDGTRGTANQRFISEAYRDLLHRKVEAGGLQHWTSLLAAGVSRQDIVAGIQQTSEYRAVQVQDLYQELLHRSADPGGLEYYTGLLAAGHTVEQVAAMVAAAPEFIQQHKVGTPAGFADALLQDVFGADIDAAVRVSFEQQMANGATAGQVAAAVFSSPEYQRHLVQGLYQHLLERAGDDGGVSFYLKEFAQGMRDEQIIAQIIGGTDEFFNRTAA